MEMEVKRTVPVKLDVPDERRDYLHRTIQQFNDAANYTVQNGRNDDSYIVLNKSKIHDRVYYDLRDRTGLTSNLCIRAYSKAVEAMKSTVADWKDGKSRPLPSFDQPSAVYDKRTLTINDRSATLSTVNGRVEAEYVLGDYQRSYSDDDEYERRMGTLHYREDEDVFYLHIVVMKGGGTARRQPCSRRRFEPEERCRDQYGRILRWWRTVVETEPLFPSSSEPPGQRHSLRQADTQAGVGARNPLRLGLSVHHFSTTRGGSTVLRLFVHRRRTVDPHP
jgi:hypothetical protein